MTVSHATRASGSLARIASRIASEISSATLSGWPSVTDSDVNRLGAMTGPPLNLPRRQGQATVWARPQAPGSYLWDAQILADGRLGSAQLQVVNARAAHESRTFLGQQRHRRVPCRLHHHVEVLPLH